MTWTCKGCGFHTVAISPDAEAHRCGNSGTWERCTCGSGGHPRECELHPEAYAAHCAELDAIAAETDEEGRANLAAALGLDGDPPAEIADELRDVLTRIP
jgi:hypothetical protein